MAERCDLPLDCGDAREERPVAKALGMKATLGRVLTRVGACGALALGAVGGAASPAMAEAATKVFLNGVPTPVYFNDGDSFRVLSGKYQGTKARLAGYNTLESYGPAHQWGTWTYKELFVLAKLGTEHARRGVWNCTSDGKLDSYGRILWDCPDLAESQIRTGLAHVLSINEKPGHPKLIEAQQDAIAARRGMWSHGVPDYIVTSLHSIAEDTGGRGAYNRLVSTADGHSMRWVHDENYKECEEVCDDGAETTGRLKNAAEVLKSDAATKDIVKGMSQRAIEVMASDWARGKSIDKRLKKAEDVAAVVSVLQRLKENGEFGRDVKLTSCMTYVDFRRRFGGGRAACLK